MSETPIDQVIGCNVRGRLEHIRELVNKRSLSAARSEIDNLLQFFPDESKVARCNRITYRHGGRTSDECGKVAVQECAECGKARCDDCVESYGDEGAFLITDDNQRVICDDCNGAL